MSDWLVKAPARQEYRMMCRYLECKLEIKCMHVCLCVQIIRSYFFQHKQAMTSS